MHKWWMEGSAYELLAGLEVLKYQLLKDIDDQGS